MNEKVRNATRKMKSVKKKKSDNSRNEKHI